MVMLYSGYQALEDMLAPARLGARLALSMRDSMGPVGEWPLQRRMFALMDIFQGARLTHKRPAYGIDQVRTGNAVVSVREEVLLDLPFGNLLHFAKDDVDTAQPRVLLVAPMSGHFSTLLRATVRTLLSDHDVYITD
ncbi:MAG TPA: polyhydroxyalkanoate depolymerase, partial [Sphingobium sp.]|nr:polyhydroxyalkanoate depolymerase [Sphingobium sp.]